MNYNAVASDVENAAKGESYFYSLQGVSATFPVWGSTAFEGGAIAKIFTSIPALDPKQSVFIHRHTCQNCGKACEREILRKMLHIYSFVIFYAYIS